MGTRQQDRYRFPALVLPLHSTRTTESRFYTVNTLGRCASTDLPYIPDLHKCPVVTFSKRVDMDPACWRRAITVFESKSEKAPKELAKNNSAAELRRGDHILPIIQNKFAVEEYYPIPCS